MNKRDFFYQTLQEGDEVLVAAETYPRSFRVANVVRFTGKAVVITRAGKSEGKKPLYVKPSEVIKMTEEMKMLNCFRILNE
jgi:hypothetical protein